MHATLHLGPARLDQLAVGERSAALLATLFAFEAPDAEGAPKVVLRDAPEDEFLVEDVDGTQAMAARSEAIDWLLDRATFRLSEPLRDGLFLHAGVTAVAGGGVLWPGESGAGKSTLVAALARRGHGYRSDEGAVVPYGTRSLYPLRRAVHLKAGSMDVARREGLLPPDAVAHRDGALLPLHRDAPAGLLELKAIVFPRYRHGASATLEPISRAQAAHRLLLVTINARNLPHRTLAAIAELVRQVPALTLEYGTFEALPPVLEEIERVARHA